ncbi:hypothetical protein DL93DRAFT_1097565 [Clavulina sp. PMI_390]|nr:hypothetical protein DL93DRAFT_1097565 [Clavulina sp. PMI_390]
MTTEISTFPDELLLLIFEHTVLDFRDPAATRLAGLIALTSINALWRTLIIEDAEFWTDVHVKVCNHSISHTNPPISILPGDFARVQGFLDRSKELPIQLRIARTWALWDNMADEEAAERDWKWMKVTWMRCSPRCSSNRGVSQS